MSVALLFPGQGTQHAGMLQWLDAEPPARRIITSMDRLLGVPWRTGLRDAAWSQSNRAAQLVLTGTSLAAWCTLSERLPGLSAVAGYSVGEVAACAAAGMLDPESALRLSECRALAMDACSTPHPGGLMAVSGVGTVLLREACERWNLEIAIRIADDRCIVGGRVDALDAALHYLESVGGQLTPLGIRVASHTSAMQAAVPVLREAFTTFDWSRASAPWVSCSRGAVVRDVAAARGALAEQVATTVRWDECMDTVAERRPACVLEVGPGTTLARMWRERHPDIPVRSCEDFHGPADICAWVADHGMRPAISS